MFNNIQATPWLALPRDVTSRNMTEAEVTRRDPIALIQPLNGKSTQKGTMSRLQHNQNYTLMASYKSVIWWRV